MDLGEAISLHRRGDLDGAERAYRAVLAASDDTTALCNLGSILRGRGRSDDAEILLRRAVYLQPERAPPRLNLANLLWRTGRVEEAAAEYEAIVGIDPGHAAARRDLGNVLLILGRDSEGWANYEARPERGAVSRHRLSFPEWRGEPLAGKRLLVIAEQGLGDMIFAARYLAGLDAARVTVACPPSLSRLFSQLPVDTLPWREGMAVERHDYWSLPLSLPRWARPSPAPYLAAASQVRNGFGVAWRGNALPDPNRSLPPELAEELLSMPGAVSLDPEASGARDLQETADLIAGLKLVVSVDTSVAHLSGAMGRPTIVLLQHRATDWRWREHRPWYPTARLVRQPANADWPGAVRAAKSMVRALAG